MVPLVCVLPRLSIGKPPDHSEGAFASSAIHGGAVRANRCGPHRVISPECILADYATRCPEAVPLCNISASGHLLNWNPERDSDSPGNPVHVKNTENFTGYWASNLFGPGFSPFELVFHWTLWGVLVLINGNWEEGPSTSYSEIQYVLDRGATLHFGQDVT